MAIAQCSPRAPLEDSMRVFRAFRNGNMSHYKRGLLLKESIEKSLESLDNGRILLVFLLFRELLE